MQKVYTKLDKQLNLIEDTDTVSSSKSVKLPDGTLIQWGTGIYQNGFNNKIVFDEQFINTDYSITATIIWYYAQCIPIFHQPERTQISISFKDMNGATIGDISESGNTIRVFWIAVGKWK